MSSKNIFVQHGCGLSRSSRAHKTTIYLCGDDWTFSRCMRIIYLARKQPANSSIERLRAIIGNLAYRWMYGEKPMAMLIDQAGPVAIRGRRFNDLDDSSFVDVEDPTRFSDSGYWELGMEASVVSPNLEAYPAFLHQTE